MRFLVTGASGFIGSALCERLLAEGHSLICLSRSLHADTPGVNWIRHDLANDPWNRLPRFDIDAAFHLAGQTSTYRARQDPMGDASVNVLGLLGLMDYLKSLPSKPFLVIAGTVTEVGVTDRIPINEAMADHPVTFYDISKLAAEMYLMQYVREGWLRGCSLRLANVFGRRSAGQQADRGILDRIFSQAMAGRKIAIYGDGTCLRDYIFIDDVVSALIAAPANAQRTGGRHFCIGSGRGISLKDAFVRVISRATELTGVRACHEHVEPPADLSQIEFRNAVIDSTEFTRATGWTPQFNFEAGLDAAYRDLPGE
ncbi:NAD-dependent epimerase/dehydratase family protein [Sulfuritalea sp.]|uniref:NAD-dependent epimerase/dehydratase family protein n=1 Tax=Sulfuritalea sp. TaxID=2480090 RepID=UPI001AD3C22C|nr:NAD-dependent epimerase/dehydratase family protein [Sulfuritalea sp.]MBN8473927.1 NAD-dependent epimerase/dehydratase family protein [Sulfuritalea sp.]